MATASKVFPARDAAYGHFPERVDGRLAAVLAARGIEQPYTHQAEAIEHALAGRHVVVVTPTASGKTLCYNVPVLSAILAASSSRARYLFPTKALAQDQLTELDALADGLRAGGDEVGVYTYDGDTPQDARRAIERGLRDGSVRGVVSTNALELGVDIGSLDVCVMAGYPGTIAATWQRAGRADRRSSRSAAVLVASSAPVDQFIIQHPEFFFDASPERALINPDNRHILLDHIKCATFELPLTTDERFGGEDLATLLGLLAEESFVYQAKDDGTWHWTTNPTRPTPSACARSPPTTSSSSTRRTRRPSSATSISPARPRRGMKRRSTSWRVRNTRSRVSTSKAARPMSAVSTATTTPTRSGSAGGAPPRRCRARARARASSLASSGDGASPRASRSKAGSGGGSQSPQAGGAALAFRR